jgi:hypothetical protein
VSNYFAESLTLLRRGCFIKRDQSPVHLTLGKIATQIAGDPELGASEAGVAVVTLVDFVSIVELAVVFHFAVFVVHGRVRVEIAHAEVWTAAGLNRGGVDRPVGRGCRSVACGYPK